MAQDITEQATQDELADSLVADIPEEPQPQEQTDTEGAELQAETQDGEQAEEQTEDEADYLPTEQEKVFPDEVLARYAQRYGVDLSKADPQLRQLVIDKINSDIYLRTLSEQREQEAQAEPKQEERETEPTRQPEQPQITREQYFKGLQEAVTQRTDPQVANDFYREFMTAFGVPDAEIQALAPQQAMNFTRTMSTYALNLINTFADDLISARLGHHIESNYPQFGEMYQISAAARTWDAVRSETSPELPAYGTPEYSTAARKIGAEIAGSAERFERMVFTGKDGKPLNERDNLAEKQRMIAERMVRGEKAQPPPAIVAQAVQTGQKMAQRAQAQRAAGNLSAGKSRQQPTGGDDDFWADGLAVYQNQHGRL